MPSTTQVFSVISTKGGVGKTTTAANLGGLLASLGLRVLLLDCDMQPALTKFFVLQGEARSGMAEVIARGGLIQSTDIISTAHDGLDIICSNISDQTQAWLKEREDRLVLLKRAVRQPVVRDQYDVVVIDTQGAKGELQRTAAMAADVMISPLRPDMMSYSEFYSGTLDMLGRLNSMADLSAEFRSGSLCVLINGTNNTVDGKTIAGQIRADFRTHPSIKLLGTELPQSTAFPTSRTLSLPVHLYDRKMSAVMHKLAFELMPNLNSSWGDGDEGGEVTE